MNLRRYQASLFSLFHFKKYDFSSYLKQSLELVEDNVHLVFGKEKDKQVGLGSFMK